MYKKNEKIVEEIFNKSVNFLEVFIDLTGMKNVKINRNIKQM